MECRRIDTLRRLNELKKCECGKQIESKYDRCWTCYNAKKATCIECHKKFDNKDKFTRCFDCASSSKKAFVPKYKNNVIRKECHECNDTLVSYWSDDVYGPCMQCCCINCEKKVCDCVD